jgi:hypothetical protein
MSQDVMLTVSYQSLGKLLAQLGENPAVNASPELAEKVRQAALFHRQMADSLDALLQEQEAFRAELSRVTREEGERVCGEPPRHTKYEAMRAAGSGPDEVYFETKADGLDRIQRLRVLRHVFHLSLDEAEQVAERVEFGERQPVLK